MRYRLLLPVLLGLWLGLSVSELQAQSPDVANVSFQQRDAETVVITYDLLGEQGQTYEVEVYISSDGGQTFHEILPANMDGDVGEGVSPGEDKSITWLALNDFPGGLQGERFRFQVRVYEEGGSAAASIVGGTLVLGTAGTGVALKLGFLTIPFIQDQIPFLQPEGYQSSGESQDGTGSGDGQTSLPEPPGRPAQ